MQKKKVIVVFAVFFGVLVLVGMSGGIWFWARQEHPKIIKTLPNPLKFDNGSMVTTAEQWQIRREEIKNIVQNIEYGHFPGRPDALRATEIGSETFADGTIHKNITLSIIPSNSTPLIMINFTLWVYIPNGTISFPTIVKPGKDGRGSQDPISNTMLNRGYIFVCYDHEALDPDTKGNDVVGPCQAAYPTYDWGSIAVWAWGAMRIADYLVGEPWIEAPAGFLPSDPDKLIITGHSRLGKVALLTGAFDERFAMVDPNGSGCGGVGSFLIQGSGAETIAFITHPTLYFSWFHKNFNEYAFKERNLDFDQHFLRALIAPRLLLSTDGLNDYWANPPGTQAMWEASNPVFELLGVKEYNAIHYRCGGHGFIAEDFAVMLNFADKYLLGYDISDDFYMQPFKFDFEIE